MERYEVKVKPVDFFDKNFLDQNLKNEWPDKYLFASLRDGKLESEEDVKIILRFRDEMEPSEIEKTLKKISEQRFYDIRVRKMHNDWEEIK